jgi:SAM-dependent methyltransferase
MHIPLRTASCDAAICIAVMHHLSTRPRRIRCLQELARIVKKGGTVNVQAWAFEQENNSRRKFAGTDVFVPFNSQPRYLDKVSHGPKKNKKKDPKVVQNQPKKEEKSNNKTSSVAERYSEVYDGAEYDDRKGLVVFQRYCHMYREGELDSLVSEIDSLEILETGFETGNHFMILKVV